MRRIILIIFLFFTFLHSNNFDVEVDKNLETKLKPNIFNDDMDFTKLSTSGYISIFSKSLNKEFKLRVINSLVVKGIIPLVKDWELKNNNLKFSNIPDDISLIGYGSYMGEKKKKKEAQQDYVCSNGKLDVNNIDSGNKKLFIIVINKNTNKFYKQYYGDFKKIITFKNCIENNTYIIKKRFFNENYEKENNNK